MEIGVTRAFSRWITVDIYFHLRNGKIASTPSTWKDLQVFYCYSNISILLKFDYSFYTKIRFARHFVGRQIVLSMIIIPDEHHWATITFAGAHGRAYVQIRYTHACIYSHDATVCVSVYLESLCINLWPQIGERNSKRGITVLAYARARDMHVGCVTPGRLPANNPINLHSHGHPFFLLITRAYYLHSVHDVFSRCFRQFRFFCAQMKGEFSARNKNIRFLDYTVFCSMIFWPFFGQGQKDSCKKI